MATTVTACTSDVGASVCVCGEHTVLTDVTPVWLTLYPETWPLEGCFECELTPVKLDAIHLNVLLFSVCKI